jgi:hypothetical protein
MKALLLMIQLLRKRISRQLNRLPSERVRITVPAYAKDSIVFAVANEVCN